MKRTKCPYTIAGFVVSLIVFGPLHRSADIETLRKAVEAEIARSGIEVSLALKDLQTGQTLFIKEKDMVHAASTMKVPVLIEVFKQAEEGKFWLDDRIVVKNEFRSIVDASPFFLNPDDDSDVEIYGLIGTSLTIRELAERMITLSSNLATNILVDLVGADRIMSTLELLGIRRMRVLRGVEDSKAFEKGWNNLTDALDLMRVMETIASGRAGSPQACREMMDILERQKFRGGIPAGLPAGVRVGNKTGSISGMEHDAAIVFPPGRNPYVLAILTRGVVSPDEGEALIARLSKMIYGHFIRD